MTRDPNVSSASLERPNSIPRPEPIIIAIVNPIAILCRLVNVA